MQSLLEAAPVAQGDVHQFVAQSDVHQCDGSCSTLNIQNILSRLLFRSLSTNPCRLCTAAVCSKTPHARRRPYDASTLPRTREHRRGLHVLEERQAGAAKARTAALLLLRPCAPQPSSRKGEWEEPLAATFFEHSRVHRGSGSATPAGGPAGRVPQRTPRF